MRGLQLLALLTVAWIVTSASAADSPAVTALDAASVRRAFERGAPLLETSAYKIHASRRETAGQVEVHALDTDIVYVLEGSAVLVTGGRLIEGHESAPHEIRGRRIEGGEPHRLAQGDVIVVPSGMPHWFSEVQGPFLYYVVKVTEGAHP